MALRKKNFAEKNTNGKTMRGNAARDTRLSADFQQAPPPTTTDKYYSIFNSIEEGFCIYEVIYDAGGKPVDLRWMEVNPAYEKQTGLKDVVGKTHAGLSLATESYWFEIYDKVAKTGESVQFENWHEPTQHWYHVFASRIDGPKSRQVSCVFNDITERKLREKSQAFFAEIFKDLLEFHNFSDVEPVLAEKIGRYFNAKWCTFTERDTDDENYIVSGWNDDDVKSIKGKHRIRNYLSEEQAARDNSGEPTIVNDTQADPRVNAATYAAMGMGSYILIPLSSSGVCKFRLVIASNTKRSWRHSEIELARELASRIWPRIQRARSEEALRHSNEVVRLAIEASNIFWWKVDFGTNIVACSPNSEKVVGRTLGQTIEENALMIHPDDRESCARIFHQAVQTHTDHFRCQVRSNAVLTELRWFHISGTVTRNDDDKPIAAIGVAQNITRRMRHEEHLAFLNEVSGELERMTDVNNTMKMLAERIGIHLSVSHCRFVELDEHGETGTLKYSWQRADLPEIAGSHRISDFLSREFKRKMNAGETVVVNDVWADPLTNGEKFSAIGIGSFVTVPFQHEGAWRFSLGLYRAEPSKWQRDEVALVGELTRRIWTRLRRARAEEALRKSEEKYRAIFNSINEGFSLLDVQFDDNGHAYDIIVRDANPAQKRIDGIQAHIGKRIREILPDIEFKWIQRYADVVQTGESSTFEDWSEANQRWYKVHASRVGGRRSTQVAIVYDDITERKQREEQQIFLLRFSDMLRTESNPDAIIDTALEMLFSQLQLDRCYVGFFRLEADLVDLVHQIGNDRVPPLPNTVRLSDFPEALRVAFERTLVVDDATVTKELSDFDKQNMQGLGVRALIAVTIRKGKQNPVWSIGGISANPRWWTPVEIKLMEEVTERTWTAVEKAKAEQALRISQKQLAKELDDAKLLHYVSNLGIREGDMERFNDALLEAFTNIMHSDMASIQILSPEKNELYLQAYKNLHPDSVKFWRSITHNSTTASARALVKRERVILSDIETVSDLAEEDLLAYRLSNIRSVQSTVLSSRSGKFLGVVSTHWKHVHQPTERELNLLDVLARQTADLIERKLADEELKKFNLRLEQQVSERTAELKESQHALEERNKQLEHTISQLESFNYIASHDLQEPLRKVRTFAYLLAEYSFDNEKLNSFIEGINRSTARMSNLIDSLLTYSRTAQPKDAFRTTDLNQVLEDVKTDFELVIKEKQAKITSDELPIITAIPFQMHQLFANLIGNSLKFSSRKPEIAITYSTVQGSEIALTDAVNPSRDYAKLTVTDNGIGFNNRHSEKIFQVFQRLHSKSEYSGAGIGLSIVERIVKNHGGYIIAKGEKDVGAVFTIYLGL
jgi:PAS domain S-box-containing protein